MSTADNQGQSDGAAGGPPPGNGAPGEERPGYGRPAGPPASEDEVSLLDILLVLARNKTLIVRIVAAITGKKGTTRVYDYTAPQYDG